MDNNKAGQSLNTWSAPVSRRPQYKNVQALSRPGGTKPQPSVRPSFAPGSTQIRHPNDDRGARTAGGRTKASRRTGATQNMQFPGRTANNFARDFSLGLIISAPHVVPNLDPEMTEDDTEFLKSDLTGPICVKFRPMIIIGICPDSLVCLPLMTNGGKYLQNTRPATGAGAMWVCSSLTRHMVPPGTSESRVLTSDAESAKMSVVYTSQPCTISMKYQIGRARYGCLLPEDLKKLMSCYDFQQKLLRGVPAHEHERKLNERWTDLAAVAAATKLSERMNGLKLSAPPARGNAKGYHQTAWTAGMPLNKL